MNHIRKLIAPVTAFSLIFAVSCGAPSKGPGERLSPDDTDSLTLELPAPPIPPHITDPAEKTAYSIEHFWDALDFSDTVRSLNRDVIEQNFANFAYALPYVAPATRQKAVVTLLVKSKVCPAAYALVTEVAEKYLYDPNSPMMSEELYSYFLEEMVRSPFPDVAAAIRPAAQLADVKLNAPGTVANDFGFVTREGSSSSLYAVIKSLPRSDSQLLLVFYDPDCDNCHALLEWLSTDESVNAHILTGDLTVLAIHSGEMLDLWKETASELPKGWIVGYDDGSLQEEGRFHLRAAPTIYIIGADRRVIAKDARIN